MSIGEKILRSLFKGDKQLIMFELIKNIILSPITIRFMRLYSDEADYMGYLAAEELHGDAT
jgi:hypothetical protein